MAKRCHRPSHGVAGRPRFWGRHAVTAALANPERTVRKVWGTREALAGLDLPPVIPITYADVTDLARLVPGDAPHQGIVAEVEPLRSEEHTSELQSLMRHSYAVFSLKKKKD